MFSSFHRWAVTARPIVGLILLLLVSLFSTIKVAKPAEHFGARFFGITEIVPDNVTLNGSRFSALRAVLPHHGTVGYITDHTLGYSDEIVAAVQYALAPVLVLRDRNYPLVVGNITQPRTDIQELLRENNLLLLKDCGEGVLLLAGTPK